MGEDEQGWFAQVSVDLPIFQGLEREGRYKKEKATLEQNRHELRRTIDTVELTVRKAYQTVLENRQEVEILRETVSISRERLRVEDRLKELGKITDNELETFRNKYFQDMDNFFTQQIALIEAQESLRLVSHFFEPVAQERN